MAFDGMVIRALARELNEKLYMAKIEKIYQPQKDELVVFFHTPNGKVKLYGSSSGSHPGVFITEKNYENPLTPGNFCMFLRKHLTGGRVSEVRQHMTERITEIYLETRDDMGFGLNRKLVFEIMGKHSNIILVDTKTDTIMESIKHLPPDINRARDVLPGRPYIYPPGSDKIPFTEITSEYMAHIWADETLGKEVPERMVGGIQGLSPLVARELSSAFSPEDAAGRLSHMAQAALSKPTPSVYICGDTPADIHVLPIEEYKGRFEKKDFETVSSALEWYYDHKSSANRMRQKSSALTSSVNTSLKKLRLKKQRLGDDLIDAKNSDKYRLYGELLTANMHLVGQGEKSVTLTNYYDGSTVEIPLDEKLQPSKNAQRYFKKYSKAKRAVTEKTKQLEETDRDIQYLESIAHYIQKAETPSQLDSLRQELYESGFIRNNGQKKKSRSGASAADPYRFKTSAGLRVLVGKNNRENDYLTFKVAGRNDIWFHVKDIPGSHVILFTGGKDPDEKSLRQAASIAAYYSKARSSENVPVDYTRVRYVRKPSGAKPGMVIFTDNKTLYVTPEKPEGHIPSEAE